MVVKAGHSSLLRMKVLNFAFVMMMRMMMMMTTTTTMHTPFSII